MGKSLWGNHYGEIIMGKSLWGKLFTQTIDACLNVKGITRMSLNARLFLMRLGLSTLFLNNTNLAYNSNELQKMKNADKSCIVFINTIIPRAHSALLIKYQSFLCQSLSCIVNVFVVLFF